MRIIALLFFIPAITSAQVGMAQSPPWIDISGPWRMTEGDDPRYSQPDFDDSRWGTVRMPDGIKLNNSPERYLWLRRTVELPAGNDGRHLALTLGRISENYQVFVDGRLVGSAGDFTRAGSRIARPETYDLPPVSAPRIVIAVRVWIFHDFLGANAWRNARDPGPYLLTGVVNAPRTAGEAFIGGMRLARTLDLVTGVALLTLAMILALMYLNQRSLQPLFWLALYATTVAARRLQVVLFITPEATPWNSFLEVTALQNALFLEFVLASLAVPPRWFRSLAWFSVLAGWGAFDWVRNWPLRFVQVLIVGALGWPVFRRTEVAHRHWITISAAAVFLASAVADSPIGTIFAPFTGLLVIRIGPYQITLHPILATVFILAMVLVLTRRLLADSAEKQRMAGEFEAARTVQSLLLTRTGTHSGEYTSDASYHSALQVGGDFYWMQPAAEGSLLCAVGDVSGKGLKAAMVVSLLTGALRNRKADDPEEILRELNHVVSEGLDGGFATAQVARFHADGRVTIANAGHLSPYLAGAEVAVESGLPLGIAAEAEYPECTIQIKPGQQVTFVSDGVVEAASASGELFGFERTREISVRSPGEIAEAAKAWGQNDDITVVTVRRAG